MSAAGIPYGEGRSIGRIERPRLEEGWSSVGLLAIMLAVVAIAIDDSGWVGVGPHGESQTGFLVWAILLGGAWGVTSAKTRLPPPLAHFGGALLAAPFLILAAAASISLGSTPAARIDDLVMSFNRFYYDLVVRGLRSPETAPFLLTIGAVAWGTGQFAAFSIFRRHRPLAAIFVAGVALVANIAITVRFQYPFLVVFAAAALLLLVRMNIVEQSEGWLRRRIGDAEVKSLFLRGGLAFVAAAIAGTLLLTATASSDPLAGAWDDFDETIVEVAQDLNAIVGGVSGGARGPTALFGSSQTVSGQWIASDVVVFRAASSDGVARYWRAATYDMWDGRTWHQTNRVEAGRTEPGTGILSDSVERIDDAADGRVPVNYTITAADWLGDMVLAPDAPFRADRATTLLTTGTRGPVARIDFAEDFGDGDTYRLEALVRAQGEDAGGITEAQLREAGVGYPDWTRRYFEIPDGAIGPAAYETAERLVGQLRIEDQNPYDIAKLMQDWLRNEGGFTYDTDVRGLCHGGEPVVDCFLRTRQGYCEHFAATMAMLLRASAGPGADGIPARVVFGFLPGREINTGEWEVDRGAAHAWVEVYFPDIGWIQFDPTPGEQALVENGQEPTEFPEGEASGPSPGASPDLVEVRPSPSFIPGDLDEDRTPGPSNPSDDEAGAVTTGPGGGPIPPFLVLIVGALVIAAVAAGSWTRSLRGPAPEPDAVYRGVARLAGRFGYGPRPTQTAYEYAGVLSDVVPAVRAELQTVARAKVESTYAARPPDGEGLRVLREAYRRLRLNLLRLAFRRRR